MSVSVQLEELHEQVARYGPSAYLLSVSDDAGPHVVSVAPRWEGESLVVDAGGRTSGNAAARPGVTVLWPAIDGSGFSLIVDGTATVRASEPENEVVIVPDRAVLHRSRASAEADASADAATCITVLRT